MRREPGRGFIKMQPDELQLFGWITTWRRIANYCGVSIDTVQRWERFHGLPVYRLPSGVNQGCSLVMALPSELITWIQVYDREKKRILAEKRRVKSDGKGISLH